MNDLEKVMDQLLKKAVTQEQRNEVWRAFFEVMYERLDDEEWAQFRKMVDEVIAKKGAN